MLKIACLRASRGFLEINGVQNMNSSCLMLAGTYNLEIYKLEFFLVEGRCSCSDTSKDAFPSIIMILKRNKFVVFRFDPFKSSAFG